MSINATLIAEIIVFAIFVWFTMRYVWPPLSKAMADRQKKIADGLASAERGEHELERANERASEVVKEAREKAAEIIDQANRRGTEMVEEAKAGAREEADRVLAQGRAELEQERNQARAELRGKVTDLAITAASRILRREVDAKAHQSMLDDLAKQL